MARTNDVWETGVGGTYIQTIGSPNGYDILINGTSKYLNFNTTVGSTGYGFRDNAGTMEFKNNAGAWTAFSSLSAGVASFNGRTGAVTLTSGDITTALGYSPLSGNQTITLSGDVTGSGATAITTTLATAQPGAHTWAGVQTFTPTARTSGVSPYFTLNTPADTGITANTEAIGVNYNTNTRTWVDGTVAVQREFLFQAPTYNKTTTSATFTKSGTVVITGAPISGTGVTQTNPYALWVQAGNSHFGSVLGGSPNATISAQGLEIAESNNTDGGVIVNLTNTSSGTNAFGGFNLNNDLANGSTYTHFAGMYYSSSGYTNVSFGTAFAVANQLAIQNTDGPITTAAQSNSYYNIIVGGAATTNEIARFTTTGMTIGLAGTLTGLIRFAGATSGTTILQANTTASGTLTLPAGVTNTLTAGTGVSAGVAHWTGTNTIGSTTGFTFASSILNVNIGANADVGFFGGNSNAGAAARSKVTTSVGGIATEHVTYGSAFTAAGLIKANLAAFKSASAEGMIIGNTSDTYVIGFMNGTALSNEVFRWTKGGFSISGAAGTKITAPTAWLHLAAGTATANQAPLKFASGVLLATLESGVHEYDGSNHSVTCGTLRGTLPRTLYTQTADKTVTNTVTETSIIGTGVATGAGMTLAANALIAGRTLRLRIGGIYSTPALATPSLVIKVKLGSTVIATVTTSGLLSGATNLEFDGEILITCRTTGASGTVMVHGDIEYATGVGGTIAVDPLNNAGATTTIDTTASNLLDVTVTWDAATSTRSVKSTVTTLEVLN